MLLHVYCFSIKLKYVKEIWTYFNDIYFFIVSKDLIRYDWKPCTLISWHIFCKFVRRASKMQKKKNQFNVPGILIYDVHTYINILLFKNVKTLFENHSSSIGTWWPKNVDGIYYKPFGMRGRSLWVFKDWRALLLYLTIHYTYLKNEVIKSNSLRIWIQRKWHELLTQINWDLKDNTSEGNRLSCKKILLKFYKVLNYQIFNGDRVSQT